MARIMFASVAAGLALCLAACAERAPPPAAAAAIPAPLSGERLAYIVGCVNCHHQTPKEILNAPSLVLVQTYSLPEFEVLLKTGKARNGRDLYAQGSIMGIVAREQLSHLTDEEMAAIHAFLATQWSAERAATEEAKIALFPPPTFMKE